MVSFGNTFFGNRLRSSFGRIYNLGSCVLTGVSFIMVGFFLALALSGDFMEVIFDGFVKEIFSQPSGSSMLIRDPWLVMTQLLAHARHLVAPKRCCHKMSEDEEMKFSIY